MNNKNLLKEQSFSFEGEQQLFNSVLKGYPNPKFEHSYIIPLNGRYSLEQSKSKLLPHSYDNNIIVPYVMESLLSQVHSLHKDKIYYHLKYEFELKDRDLRDVLLLVFTKIEGYFDLYINGTYVTSSNDEFYYSTDIRKYVVLGTNVLNISLRSGKTELLGISGPVYLIPLNKGYIKDVKVTFSRKRQTFTFDVDSTALSGTIKLISPNGRYKEFYFENNETEIIPDDFIEYSVKNPFFYQYEVKNEYDSVRGFISIAEYGLNKMEGINCITLNDEPLSIKGILNKNYYSDGLITPPSYEYIEREIAEIKKFHFNSVYNELFIDVPYYYYYLEINGILAPVKFNYKDDNLYKYIRFFNKFNNIYLYIINNDSKTNSKEIYNELKNLLKDKLLVIVKKGKAYGDIDIATKKIKSNIPYIICPLSFKEKDVENYIDFIENDYIDYSLSGMIGYYYDSLKDPESGLLTNNFKKRQNHSKLLIEYYKNN